MARTPVTRRLRPAVRRLHDRSHARDRDQRGAVIVEFALIVPMLLLIVFGIMDFGYMLNRTTIVSNASRDGARTASLDGGYDDICTTVKSELSDSGIAVPTACNVTTGSTIIKIDCKNVDNTPCNATSTTYDTLAVSGATAIVTITYTYTYITPLIGQLFGSTEVFTQTTQMRVE
jgi:Flp pilus assembly protein TadG